MSNTFEYTHSKEDGVKCEYCEAYDTRTNWCTNLEVKRARDCNCKNFTSKRTAPREVGILTNPNKKEGKI